MQTKSVILEDGSMKMQEFCDELLKASEVIPEDKIAGTKIKIDCTNYDEVIVWLDY